MTATRLNPAKGCTVASNRFSTALTTNGTADIATVSHTSATGKVLLIGTAVFKTSGYTTAIVLKSGGSEVARCPSPSTTNMRQVVMGAADVSKGAPTTFKLQLEAQNSSTTGTVPAWEGYALAVMDI